MEESFWDRPAVRVTLFFGIFVSLVIAAFLLARSTSDERSVVVPDGASAPTRPAPIDPVTEVPADTDPATEKRRVREYLAAYQNFTWETDVSEWSARLEALGARGAALDPPFEGASFATCVRIQCGFIDVVVSDVEETGGGVYSADVTSTFIQTGSPNTRGTSACTVRVLNGGIIDSTCLGVA